MVDQARGGAGRLVDKARGWAGGKDSPLKGDDGQLVMEGKLEETPLRLSSTSSHLHPPLTCLPPALSSPVLRPIQPPSKPDAAPFFLPTVPSLSSNPVWATSTAPDHAHALGMQPNGSSRAATTQKGRKLEGWGSDDDADADAGDEGGEGEDVDADDDGGQLRHKLASEPRTTSRVLLMSGSGPGRGLVGAPCSTFIRTLRDCGERGDYCPLLLLLRGMSATAVDRELRSIQVRH